MIVRRSSGMTTLAAIGTEAKDRNWRRFNVASYVAVRCRPAPAPARWASRLRSPRTSLTPRAPRARAVPAWRPGWTVSRASCGSLDQLHQPPDGHADPQERLASVPPPRPGLLVRRLNRPAERVHEEQHHAHQDVGLHRRASAMNSTISSRMTATTLKLRTPT